MINALPAASDIINASATATTATMITVPGGRVFTATVQLSASISAVGTSVPTVTWTVPGGTSGAAPATGSTLARLTLTGLNLTTVSDSDSTEILVYGGDNGCTIGFTAGATGSSSCVINGFLI